MHVVQDNNGKQIAVRSKLETKIVSILNETKQEWEYEVTKIPYLVPESQHKYTVDFTVNGKLLIEGKGYLSDHAERQKYVLIKQQHPNLDVCFIFDNCSKLVGGSKLTHAQWATKHGFKFCGIKDVDQIQQWIHENGKNISN